MQEEADQNARVAHRGGFAVRFDDTKRRWLREHPEFSLTKLQTVQQGTDDYFMWMGLYVAPENDTVEYIVEEDGITYTFFTRFKRKEDN